MRIIRHGNRYEIDQITCPICECEFIYNQDDVIKIVDSSDVAEEGFDVERYYVYCPECNCEMQVNNPYDTITENINEEEPDNGGDKL